MIQYRTSTRTGKRLQALTLMVYSIQEGWEWYVKKRSINAAPGVASYWHGSEVGPCQGGDRLRSMKAV